MRCSCRVVPISLFEANAAEVRAQLAEQRQLRQLAFLARIVDAVQ